MGSCRMRTLNVANFRTKLGYYQKRFPCEQKVSLESLKMSYGSYKSGVEKYLSSLSSPSNESVKQENRQNKLA
ncbi:hypothetical protein L596_017184 [Steinernema carpocapsae]|uniref:Uncharacterized protein n=1 Tax=Steinernema carpocapsae TaxID=34508 RepID=A0A4U5N0V0_STECR|nr:hypothetical protein L596_017184 [Steinernema carpocapsae]